MTRSPKSRSGVPAAYRLGSSGGDAASTFYSPVTPGELLAALVLSGGSFRRSYMCGTDAFIAAESAMIA